MEEAITPLLTVEANEVLPLQEEGKSTEPQKEINENDLPVRGCDDDANPKWGCLLCTFSAMSRSSVESHIKTVHVAPKVFFCPQCSTSGPEYSEIEQHILDIHKDVTAVVLSRKCSRIKDLVDAVCFSLPHDIKWKNAKVKLTRASRWACYLKGNTDFRDTEKYVCAVCCRATKSLMLARRHAALHWKDILQGSNSSTGQKVPEVRCDDDLLPQLFDNKRLRVMPRISSRRSYHRDARSQPISKWKRTDEPKFTFPEPNISQMPSSILHSPTSPNPTFDWSTLIPTSPTPHVAASCLQTPVSVHDLALEPLSPAMSVDSRASEVSVRTLPYCSDGLTSWLGGPRKSVTYRDGHRSFVGSDLKLSMRPVVVLEQMRPQ